MFRPAMPLRSRFPVAVAGAVLAGLVAAAPAPARIVEVGAAEPAAAPTCPSSPCLALSRTTGYQAKVADSREAYVVPETGRIVGWTISLGSPDQRQIDFFDSSYGEASARLTVLRRRDRLFSVVTAQTPVFDLAPYFGQSVQFPLDDPLKVKKGQIIALTVPTWAPALSQLTSDGSAWRASRALDDCDDTESQTAQAQLRQRTQYRCYYTARLTYSATLITKPRPNQPAGEEPRRQRRRGGGKRG